MARSILPAALGGRRLPNIWDIAAVLCVFGGLVALSHSARGTFVPLSVLETSAITLDPWALPDYALRTTLRMFAALAASLLFTFTYAPLAAKAGAPG